MDSMLNKLLGVLQTITLALAVLFQMYRSWKKEGKYSIHIMLDFPILWLETSTDSYSSKKDKKAILYVRFYFLYTTLQFTETNDHEVE